MKPKDAGADHQRVPVQPRGGARVGPLVRHNLVAIGTAAVLTVYSAGYARTRDAARRFAEADQAARRPLAPVIPVGDSSLSVAQSADAPETPSPVRSTTPGADRPVAASVPVSPPPSAPAPTPAATVDSAVASEPQRDSITLNPTQQITTPVAQATDTAGAPPAADSAAKQPLLKDGEYYGWGTSRHGDIQAGIEIKGGRITGAWIQQCLTRYSCSWIAALPGQVVARQSPEVDYVSGATQSTNAFYYAVVEALSRAK
jgi:uncharacterized protein with FMN-binding domain